MKKLRIADALWWDSTITSGIPTQGVSNTENVIKVTVTSFVRVRCLSATRQPFSSEIVIIRLWGIFSKQPMSFLINLNLQCPRNYGTGKS